MIVFLLIFVILIIIIALGIKQENNALYLSKQSTQCYKGIAAILIFLHHISQQIDLPNVCIPFKFIGFIMVGVFFFLSGYSLMINYLGKKKYLEGFLRKRMLGIYIPYWMVAIILYVIQIMTRVPHTGFHLFNVLIGDASYTNLWFTTSIIIVYVMFYFCGRFCKMNKQLMLKWMFLAICLYSWCCYYFRLPSQWNASISAFWFGMFWAGYKSRIEKLCVSRYTINLVVSSLLFVLLFSFRLLMTYMIRDDGIIQTVLRNLITVLFVNMVMLIVQKISIRSGILEWFGQISYEIYIVHFVLLYPLMSILGRTNLFVFFVFMSSIIIAYAINRISGMLQRIFKV